MNFIFISPNFPQTYWNFCERLHSRGVTVLGIGDAPYESLAPELKANLNDYYRVERMEDYDQTFRAVAWFSHKYGKIDWLESNNECLEWARIPHMYYNFYVYKYATGMSAAIQLANRILKEGKPALDDYFGFLKAGGSRDVLDIMRGAGVNLEKPEPVAAALDYFGTIVDRLEKLC